MERANIVLADPDPVTRVEQARRAAAAGHRTRSAESAEAALALLMTEPVDVVVLDQRLRQEGKQDLLIALSDCAPDVPVIVLSSDPSLPAAVEAMKLGAADFLVHPLAPGMVEAAVSRALRIGRMRRTVAQAGQGRAGDGLVGRSDAMRWVRDVLARLAEGPAVTVLLEGETGTGKEVVARAIHASSARSTRPFLKVNCAAIPETLFESAFFGHEKGAFTDAHARRMGIVEAASGGTVLLDEMGDLPASCQAKLLRLLENRTFRRVGGTDELTADVRVIAAAQVDLEDQVAAGLFRPDLFFRLNVVRVRLSPLRERSEDIPLLVASFIARFDREYGRSLRGITHEALEILEAYDWPGNVRELRNVIERAFVIYGDLDELRPGHLPNALRQRARQRTLPVAVPDDLGLAEMERRLLTGALTRSGGNQARAARTLGVTRFALRYRLRKYGIRYSADAPRPAEGSAAPDRRSCPGRSAP